MNLIYFTIGNNKDYIKLLKLCVDSLNRFDYNGDILIITEFEDFIRDSVSFRNNVIFMNLGNSNLSESASNKLKIYKYKDINNYNKIIYCDIDTIWFNSPNILFDKIKDDKIYISSEHHQSSLMSEEYWGGNMMTSIELKYINDNKIKGLNTGFFAFNNSMISVIKEIDDFLYQNLDKISFCLEQPYINVHLFRKKIYDISFDSFISNNGNFIDRFDGILLHFSAGLGNPEFKYKNMIKFL